MKTTLKKLAFALACASAVLPAVSHAVSFQDQATMSFTASSPTASFLFSWVDLITVKKEWTTESDGKYSLTLTDSNNQVLFNKNSLGDAVTGDTSGVLFGSFAKTFSSLSAGSVYTLNFIGKWNSPGNASWVPSTIPSVSISAVPEPESYAMFLAGLGLIGGIALRRAKKS
ncbi:MAG: FxDxF family PEP-CTERM protein [Azonexus sp.]|nr:FxDxF family PEP-CTERM protein [Azonexus sp.]